MKTNFGVIKGLRNLVVILFLKISDLGWRKVVLRECMRKGCKRITMMGLCNRCTSEVVHTGD